MALLAIAAATAAATTTTTTTGAGVGTLPMGQCAAPAIAAASSDQAAIAITTSRTRKGESAVAAGLADGDLQSKVEVGGGTAAVAYQASNVVRSPLGMLPGIVIGDDSSNRGTTRV